MKENLRRPLLFATIVIVGSVLILFDVPLIILIPIIFAVGFIILVILGAITVTDIKSAFAAKKPQNPPQRVGLLKRLDQMKFFEKPPATPAPQPVEKSVKGEAQKEADKPKTPSRIRTLFTLKGLRKPKPETKAVPEKDKKPGPLSHVVTLFSSIGSLGSVLQQRKKQGKKVDDINKLLDKTVSEKVHAPPPAAAPARASGSATPAPPVAGGGGLPDMSGDADPFLSLSGDEFDAGLLDGLGDDDMAGFTMPGPEAGLPESPPDVTLPAEPADMPSPAPDISSAAGDILKESGQGLEEFGGLDGGDMPEADFGDLDAISLDDLEGDLGDEALEMPGEEVAPAPAAPPSPDDSNAVKTAWIPSDAPKGADQPEDQISTQADMASFASGASADEDLLSSLASDVKHVKKDKDLSLLRELKDFRAPAGEIEEELTGMYERMKSDKLTKRKTPPTPAKGSKER